jgi:hypothetical protein
LFEAERKYLEELVEQDFSLFFLPLVEVLQPFVGSLRLFMVLEELEKCLENEICTKERKQNAWNTLASAQVVRRSTEGKRSWRNEDSASRYSYT